MSAFSRRKLLSSFAGISISTFGVSKISNKLTASQNSGTLHIPSVSSRKFVCTIDSYSNTHISLWVNQTQSLEERHRLIAIKNLFTEKSIVSSVKGPEINSSDQSRIKVSFNFESNRIEKPVQYTIVAAPSSRINNTNSYKYLTESDPFRIENQQTISSVSLTSPSETRWPYSRNNLNGTYRINYTWKDEEESDHSEPKTWNFTQRIGKSDYERARRKSKGPLKTYEDTIESNLVTHFSRNLHKFSNTEEGEYLKDTNEIEKLQAVVKFVQSLTYRTDVRSRNNFEYFRDGIETLVDTVGDCEDTSYLLAALLEREPFDYSTGMAFPPSHALPIVKQSDLPYTRDDFYTIDVNGVQYVPIESTELAPIGYTQYKNTLAVYTNGELRNINPGAITRIFE